MDDQASVAGKATCKHGPPRASADERHRVLVIGDSVSIGYTPFVARALASVALVQHAPSGGDGGAEETAYGVQCLDFLLAHPDGAPLIADVIVFNWGLHDGPQLFAAPPANVTIPGQEGSMTPYASELRNLTLRLQGFAASAGAKLLFALTTPLLANPRADADVRELNRRAASVMRECGVPTLDLHAAVVGRCGTPPITRCFNASGCFSPHCAPAGYAWLAESTIAPAIRLLLPPPARAAAPLPVD